MTSEITQEEVSEVKTNEKPEVVVHSKNPKRVAAGKKSVSKIKECRSKKKRIRTFKKRKFKIKRNN